jgi:hypothetical protein
MKYLIVALMIVSGSNAFAGRTATSSDGRYLVNNGKCWRCIGGTWDLSRADGGCNPPARYEADNDFGINACPAALVLPGPFPKKIQMKTVETTLRFKGF